MLILWVLSEIGIGSAGRITNRSFTSPLSFRQSTPPPAWLTSPEPTCGFSKTQYTPKGPGSETGPNPCACGFSSVAGSADDAIVTVAKTVRIALVRAERKLVQVSALSVLVQICLNPDNLITTSHILSFPFQQVRLVKNS